MGMAALFAMIGSTNAQPNNELSDPQQWVFRAFPESNSVRTIVRDVDARARKIVEQRLAFKVHFNELGPHSLYVAFRERQPVGLVYLRTEESRWGFAEIGWALTLDLRIVGFRFRRGRSVHQRGLAQSPFARALVGRRYDQLEDLLTEDGRLAVDPGAIPDGSEELALTVLRSAMKTMVVTDTVWGAELTKLQDLSMALEAFPNAERFRRQVLRFTDRADQPNIQHLDSVHIMRAHGPAQSTLGIVARTETRRGNGLLELRWVLSPTLRITHITASDPWLERDVRTACNEIEGTPLHEAHRAAAPIGEIAAELAAVLQDLTDKGRD